MSNIIVIEESRLVELLEQVTERKMRVLINELSKKDSMTKFYSINQVAKKLGKAHSSIKKLILNGNLKALSDGRITEFDLNEYLGKYNRNG